MALLPARRGRTVARPGSQAAGRRDPFGGFEDLDQQMGRLTARAFDGLRHSSGQAQPPAADLTETGGAYIAEADLPSVPKDDISVELAGHRTGGFEFRVMLPGKADPDKVTAALADGVLTVTVPKAEAGRPRRVEVTGG
jgi:HSP20 family protein